MLEFDEDMRNFNPAALKYGSVETVYLIRNRLNELIPLGRPCNFIILFEILIKK